jgi:hypothetical protein
LGRHKIEGSDICPICEQLGRFSHFSSRNGEYKNARSREYIRFIHNDKTIKDHYGIEEALRKKEIEKIRNGPNSIIGEELFLLAEKFKNLENMFKKTAENVRETNIDPKDDKKYALMFRKGFNDLMKTHLALLKYINLQLKETKTPEEQQAINKFDEILDNMRKKEDEYDKLRQENPKKYLKMGKKVLKKDKMFMAMHLWFKKYEKPKREKARKELSEKLSESAFGSSKHKADYIINRKH